MVLIGGQRVLPLDKPPRWQFDPRADSYVPRRSAFTDSGGAALDHLLEETRLIPGQMSHEMAAPSGIDEPLLIGQGVAADGKVEAAVVKGGKMRSIQVDPQAMRLGSEVLGEEIVLAVNAALDTALDTTYASKHSSRRRSPST